MLGASPIPPSTTHRHNTVQAFCTISHELFDNSNMLCIQSSSTRPSISYDHRVSTPPASCPAQPTPSILFLCVECVLPNCRRSENTVTDDLLILVTAACTAPAPHPSTRSPWSARTIDTFLYFHSMSGFTFRSRFYDFKGLAEAEILLDGLLQLTSALHYSVTCFFAIINCNHVFQ